MRRSEHELQQTSIGPAGSNSKHLPNIFKRLFVRISLPAIDALILLTQWLFSLSRPTLRLRSFCGERAFGWGANTSSESLAVRRAE